MKQLNFVMTSTLIAILIWVAVEAGAVSKTLLITPDLLETSLPIDGTIDTDYLSNLGKPANVR